MMEKTTRHIIGTMGFTLVIRYFPPDEEHTIHGLNVRVDPHEVSVQALTLADAAGLAASQVRKMFPEHLVSPVTLELRSWERERSVTDEREGRQESGRESDEAVSRP